MKASSLALMFICLLPMDALACHRPQGFVAPTASQLMAQAKTVIFGPIEVINGKVIIQPEKTLKKSVQDKQGIVFSGGTCGHVQPNWLSTGDYCLVYLDDKGDAGEFSSCTMGDKNGVQKKRLVQTFKQLEETQPK